MDKLISSMQQEVDDYFRSRANQYKFIKVVLGIKCSRSNAQSRCRLLIKKYFKNLDIISPDGFIAKNAPTLSYWRNEGVTDEYFLKLSGRFVFIKNYIEDVPEGDKIPFISREAT